MNFAEKLAFNPLFSENYGQTFALKNDKEKCIFFSMLQKPFYIMTLCCLW
jgi:hypothetical protein